ncbi:hypothetical protein R5577_08205 [Xanthomonas euvesicatoria]|uniref:Uncharacterized protein n=1 Tax=Xanthomonas euvesicatoria TaxID=456327 RepID=A0AAX4FQH1_XANEU|nr:hypothetical protein [Xanthomonas euvesicatoria]WOP58748.1 hypothetical protein R5577_08205 [Xanthomonas euvesicatoria]
MDTANAAGYLQPQAALVQAELRQQQRALRIADHPHAAGGMTDDPVDAGLEGMIRLLPVGEMNLQVAHPRSLAGLPPCAAIGGDRSRAGSLPRARQDRAAVG